MHSQSGELTKPDSTQGRAQDWKVDVVDLFKSGQVKQARTVLCSSARPDEMEDVFRWMYDNITLWSDDVAKQDQAIVIIRNGLVNHSFVADPEINLSATMIELANL
jgi:hypothetical protein